MAFELARGRRNKVHSLEKSNVMESGLLRGGRWSPTCTGASTPTSSWNTCWPTTRPCSWCASFTQFDVLLTDNLFGDVLPDR